MTKRAAGCWHGWAPHRSTHGCTAVGTAEGLCVRAANARFGSHGGLHPQNIVAAKRVRERRCENGWECLEDEDRSCRTPAQRRGKRETCALPFF
jgi:hypothetical protein